MRTVARLLRLACCLVVVLTFASARAQTPIAPTASSPSTDPMSSYLDLSVAPRFWYMYSTFANGKPIPGQTSLSTSAAVTFPMTGVGVTAKFPALPATTFLLSGLYGAGTEKISLLSVGDTRLGSFHENINRYDFEFLASTQIHTYLSWVAGVRYEQETQAVSTLTFPAGIPTSSSSIQPSLKDYTVKAGLSGVVPVSRSEDLSMFGSLLAFGGPEISNNQVTNGILGTDLSVGLSYQPMSSVSVDLRYRAVVSFLIDAPPGNGSHYISHGPMLIANIFF
jgi:hypothetical protein